MAVCLLAAGAAESELGDGTGLSIGPLTLRLAHNSGVAFSLGDALPASAVVAATGLLTMAIVVYAFTMAPRTTPLGRAGLSLLLAGAAANLIDRSIDGLVTDYFHTGWWPTFNLADTFITTGLALVIVAALRSPKRQRAVGASAAESDR